MKFCPNVTDVTVNNFSDVFNPQNQIYWRKLKSFQFNYNSGDKNLIEIFVENNKTSLETINVKIDYMTSEDEINNLFDSLSKLTKIKRLTIRWWSTSEVNDITVIKLKKLAINCQQLKIIYLYLTEINSIEMSLKIFRVMKCFINMKILRLTLYSDEDEDNSEAVIITSNELKGLQNLTHFRLKS